MTKTIGSAPQPLQPSLSKKAWLYFSRSFKLNCPVCGISPLFRPLRKTKSLRDWFETLPGCSQCDYIYDREPGYFMLALWSFDYGAAALFGIALLLFFTIYLELSTLPLLLLVIVPTFIFALLIVRHSKAFYLAIDRYFFHTDEN